MKKLLCMLMACLLVAGFAACGGDKNPTSSGGDNGVHTLNIVMSSGEISAKSDDNYVKSKIEEKFLKDRGIKISLNVEVYSESDFNTVMSNRMASNKWDAAVGYLGQAGIDEIVISQNVCMEIGSLIETYPSLYALVKDELTATTTIDGSVYGVPSMELTNQYGVLVRADYMEQVGYTTEPGHNDDLGAVTEPAGEKRKTLANIDDMTDMLRRMKKQISQIDYPLSGYPWDIESTLTVGPYSNAGYTFKSVEKRKDDGTAELVVPGQISDNYLKTLKLEYLWQKEGLWEEEAYTGQKDAKISAFVNGRTGVYVVDPEIVNLINITRRVKAADPDARFTVLEPLYGVEDGVQTAKRGYMGKQSANSCLVINRRSKESETVMEYLDWLASDKANYDLATYGVQGEHWVDAGEGKYTYPENKKEQYELRPPYSGMYGLLKWQKYSYRLYDNYTDEEYGWINTVRTAPVFTNVCSNMLFIEDDEDMMLNHQTAENDFFQDCLVKVWNGVLDPATEFAKYQARYRETADTYISWLTRQYNLYVTARS